MCVCVCVCMCVCAQASEHDVFLALLGWYQHKSGAQQPSSDAGPSQRSPAPQQPQQPQQLAASEPLRPLDQLAKQCVRAHLLTMKELEALDAHPEVGTCVCVCVCVCVCGDLSLSYMCVRVYRQWVCLTCQTYDTV